MTDHEPAGEAFHFGFVDADPSVALNPVCSPYGWNSGDTIHNSWQEEEISMPLDHGADRSGRGT